MARTSLKPKKTQYTVKRCPECFTELALDATVCVSCKKKVGKVNSYGIAGKPVNWFAYAMCSASWIVFLLYIWWAFL